MDHYLHLGLDNFDCKIMSEMQIKGLIPLREIGDSVGLSIAAVQRRLKRLVDEGYVRYEVVISPEKLGVTMTIITEISLHNNQGEHIATFEKKLVNPNVQQVFKLTGGTDYIIIMKVISLEEYETICAELFSDTSLIKNSRMIVVRDILKSSDYIPME